MSSQDPPGPVADQAHRPFRPYRGRVVALGFAVGSAVLFGVLAAAMPATGLAGWGTVDSLLLLGFGLLVAALMWRFATVRASPDPGGLLVRNLLVSQRLAWAQIEGLRFRAGDPWVVLVLVDGEEVAVMAVQRSDGERSRAEAARLVALIRAHGSGGRR
jgi:hypothetical protein